MANQSEEKSVTENEQFPKSSPIDDDNYVAIPPDGGFGWVVVAACFVINVIVDGFLYSFGTISDDIKRYFGCGEWEVSFVISLAYGFYFLCGPIASGLCNKWGCRQIGIIGSITAALSVAASVYSPSIYIMWVLFGIIGGIGFGLVYLPSMIMPGCYFTDRRPIAIGIVTAGTGIGTITFAKLSPFLFKTFGWKYGLIILSAIVLLCIVCCIPLIPVKPQRVERPTEENDTPLLEKKVDTDTPLNSLPDHNSIEHGSNTQEAMKFKRTRTISEHSTRSKRSISAEDAMRPFNKEDVFFPGDVKELPEYKLQQNKLAYLQETIAVPESQSSSPMKAFWDAFLQMTNFHLLSDKRMTIMCVANIFSMIGYIIPYLFIVKVAQFERSISPEKANEFLLIIGVSNTIGRVMSGLITKIPKVTSLQVNNIGLFTAGIATLLVPFCTTYLHFLAFCVIWGGFIAFHVTSSIAIVCETFDLEKMSNGIGLTLMFRGITSLLSPPAMGAIYDWRRSFNIPFTIGGFSLILSGLLYASLKCMEPKETKLNNPKTQIKTDV